LDNLIDINVLPIPEVTENESPALGQDAVLVAVNEATAESSGSNTVITQVVEVPSSR
jgi:hypothetical protein